MNNLLIIVCLIIDILICFGIPIGYLIYIIIKKRESIRFYFVGVAAFVISQELLRLPILSKVLPNMTWFIYIENFEPIIYCIFLGITAGLFEEIARFIGFKVILKNKSKVKFENGIAFGMGHGGIEAILIGGFASINGLLQVINSNMLLNISLINVLMTGIERVFAITIHVGLSLLVLYGIRLKKIRYLFLAILVHGIVDSFGGIITVLGFNIYLAEGWTAICAIVLLIFTIKVKNTFKEGVGFNEKTM